VCHQGSGWRQPVAASCLRLLEQIFEPTVIHTVLEPGCLGEEAGQVGFVRALQHTAGHGREAFVVQDDQTCQVVLEMLELAPILEEVSEDISMSSHERSVSHYRKLHQAFPLSHGGRDRA
jgi:hypothetical protein